jgi:hypothetical protein
LLPPPKWRAASRDMIQPGTGLVIGTPRLTTSSRVGFGHPTAMVNGAVTQTDFLHSAPWNTGARSIDREQISIHYFRALPKGQGADPLMDR